MLTTNHIQEGLSRAYIVAVASRAGLNCSFAREFDYGIDGTFHDVKVRGGRRMEGGFKIDFQLKASQNCTVGATEVTYALEAKSYADLIDTKVGTSRILIVLSLPRDPLVWLSTSTDELTMRRCAWWISLRGHPKSSNATSKTIKIPLAQTFDVLALTKMMQRVRKGGQP